MTVEQREALLELVEAHEAVEKAQDGYSNACVRWRAAFGPMTCHHRWVVGKTLVGVQKRENVSGVDPTFLEVLEVVDRPGRPDPEAKSLPSLKCHDCGERRWTGDMIIPSPDDPSPRCQDCYRKWLKARPNHD
jgi:hypothetical protein